MKILLFSLSVLSCLSSLEGGASVDYLDESTLFEISWPGQQKVASSSVKCGLKTRGLPFTRSILTKELIWWQLILWELILWELILWHRVKTRGSHLYVPCRTVCDRDQDWIKRSKPFLRADQGIKVTSKLLKINNQECMAAIWPLTLGNQVIKASEGNDQVIKHTFCQSKKLDHGRKHFYRQHISDYL